MGPRSNERGNPPNINRPSLLTHPRRGGLNQNTGSACRLLQLAVILLFTFQFDGSKAPPNLLLLHSPSLCLTIHIPSHSEGAERVSRLPLMCPVLATVTMPG